MRKDFAIVGIMLLIVIAAVVYGIEKAHNKINPANININTSIISSKSNDMTSTKSAPVSSQTQGSNKTNMSKTQLPSIYNASLLLYSFKLMNVSAYVPNSTALYADNMYFIQISGLFNYPPGYIQRGNYTLFMVSATFTLLNGTKETVYIPIYQKVVITNQSTLRFVIQIEGNSTLTAQLYHYIGYLRSAGIYNMEVSFYLLPAQGPSDFYYVVEGVASI